IGANTTIDRGSVDDTVVGPGTKIDNLVQIGHNCRIGARCLIAGQAGIAGSTHVEDDVFLAGQAGLADHVTIGRGARVTVQGGVIGDIAPGATVSGYPARTHRERSEEHTSELQSRGHLVCRLLLEKKKQNRIDSQPTSLMTTPCYSSTMIPL